LTFSKEVEEVWTTFNLIPSAVIASSALTLANKAITPLVFLITVESEGEVLFLETAIAPELMTRLAVETAEKVPAVEEVTLMPKPVEASTPTMSVSLFNSRAMPVAVPATSLPMTSPLI